jgi:hypothetical protein
MASDRLCGAQIPGQQQSIKAKILIVADYEAKHVRIPGESEVVAE